MSDGYWTSEDARKYLAVYRSPKSWNAAIHRHGIPHRYVGGRLVFEKARLDAWVRNYRPAKRGPKAKTEAA